MCRVISAQVNDSEVTRMLSITFCTVSCYRPSWLGIAFRISRFLGST